MIFPTLLPVGPAPLAKMLGPPPSRDSGPPLSGRAEQLTLPPANRRDTDKARARERPAAPELAAAPLTPADWNPGQSTVSLAASAV